MAALYQVVIAGATNPISFGVWALRLVVDILLTFRLVVGSELIKQFAIHLHECLQYIIYQSCKQLIQSHERMSYHYVAQLSTSKLRADNSVIKISIFILLTSLPTAKQPGTVKTKAHSPLPTVNNFFSIWF